MQKILFILVLVLIDDIKSTSLSQNQGQSIDEEVCRLRNCSTIEKVEVEELFLLYPQLSPPLRLWPPCNFLEIPCPENCSSAFCLSAPCRQSNCYVFGAKCVPNFCGCNLEFKGVTLTGGPCTNVYLSVYTCTVIEECTQVRAKQQLNYSDGCNNESSSQFPPCCTEYIVKQGEEICDIAESNNLDCDLLKDFNDLEDVEEDDILQIC